MNLLPKQIAFGERYGDDSGWERRVAFDDHANKVNLDFGGNVPMSLSFEDAWWLLRALMKAREHFGVDKISNDGPSGPL
jgi:hypothetical protein